MKAIQILQFGGPEVMHLVELPDPVPTSSQTLITVDAIGINYADTHQTQNSYLAPQHLPMVPGLEVVGRTPEGVRVLAPVDGGYAQLAVAATNSLMPIPDGVSDGAALAMMVQGSTAYHILKTVGHLKVGETVVVHAGAGGVGSIAIQLAKRWGALVIAVVSVGKGDLALSLGADIVVDANSIDLAGDLLKANSGKPVDLVLEMVGGKTFEDSLSVLAPFGRLVVYGMASRVAPRAITGGELMHGSKTVSGFWLAHCFGSKTMLHDVILELFDLIASGDLTPIIGATYPLSEAGQAHTDMMDRKTTGKVVLDPAR
ncbi:MAG: zinc-binding dehydrogenase [Actinomycetes bacterium]